MALARKVDIKTNEIEQGTLEINPHSNCNLTFKKVK